MATQSPNFEFKTSPTPSQSLDKDTVFKKAVENTDLVERLNLHPRLVNRLYSEATLSTHNTFEEAIYKALTPVKPDKLRPTKDARAFVRDYEFEEMDRGFLEEYVDISSVQSLADACQRVNETIQKVLNHDDYRTTVDSYHKQDRSIDRNSVHEFLKRAGFSHLKHIDSLTPLYHGLDMGAGEMELDYHEKAELVSQENYAKRIKSILDNGLLASACPENLPGLESVFCVSNIKNAYGLAALRFFLDSRQKTWGHNESGYGAEGHQIVLPVLKPPFATPFEVVIRSKKFFGSFEDAQSKDVFGQITPKEHFEYTSDLMKRLKSLGIPFQMIDPDGTVRAPLVKPKETIAAE